MNDINDPRYGQLLNPGDRQALKHFDELLRAAQEVVNMIEEGESPMERKTGCLLVDKDALSLLKQMVQKISDEAVEIIQAQSGGGNLAVVE